MPPVQLARRPAKTLLNHSSRNGRCRKTSESIRIVTGYVRPSATREPTAQNAELSRHEDFVVAASHAHWADSKPGAVPCRTQPFVVNKAESDGDVGPSLDRMVGWYVKSAHLVAHRSSGNSGFAVPLYCTAACGRGGPRGAGGSVRVAGKFPFIQWMLRRFRRTPFASRGGVCVCRNCLHLFFPAAIAALAARGPGGFRAALIEAGRRAPSFPSWRLMRCWLSCCG